VRNFMIAAAALMTLSVSAPASEGWEPAGPVEIVVGASADGASHQMARMLQDAIQRNHLMKQPVVVSLKGVGSGAEALMDMKASAGNANKLLIASSLIYTLPLSAKLPFNWRELTPVSVVAMDQFVLWDNVDGPKTVKEFIAAAGAAQPPFRMGGTGVYREDQVLSVLVERSTGVKFSYVPFRSGGEAAMQLVDKHIDSNVNNPSENLDVWRSGEVRPLCVFDKERIAYPAKVTGTQSWNDIPTCKEEGLDVQYMMLRAMFLPGKVTPEQVAFYVDLFQKVTQTPEYMHYIEEQALKPLLLTGRDLVQFLEEDDALNTSLMTEAGFVAK
jgi:putative tricarboxylic transport membrane protein